MSQHSKHGFHIHTILQGDRCECMPQIAEVVRFWTANVLTGQIQLK